MPRWIPVVALALLLSACGTEGRPLARTARTPPLQTVTPTATTSAPSRTVTRTTPAAPPSRSAAPTIDGFRRIAATGAVSVSSATLQAMGRVLATAHWTLTMNPSNPFFSHTVAGWTREPSAVGGPPVYRLQGAWGQITFAPTTVQAALSPTLAPEVIWSYTALPTAAAPLPAAQAQAAAMLVTAQLRTLAAAMPPQTPRVVITVTNAAGHQLATVGGSIWYLDDLNLGWDPYAAPTPDGVYGLAPVPPPAIIRWVQETV